MSPTTVLIVDNHAHFRRSLSQLCEINGGFAVVGEAGSGGEALVLAQQTAPDVALVDMHLPDMDGAETTRLLLRQNPALVVVLLSFAWEAESLERASRSGAHCWLAKDCEESALFAAMRDAQRPAAAF